MYDGRHLLVYVDASAGDAVPLEGAQLGDPGGFTLGGAADWAVLNLQGELAEAATKGGAAKGKKSPAGQEAASEEGAEGGGGRGGRGGRRGRWRGRRGGRERRW